MTDTQDRTMALKKADVFAGLGDDDFESLARIVLLKQFVAGERIFSLGDEARTLLVVVDGTVGLTLPLQIKGQHDEVVIEEKSAGSVIAWSALVPPHKFTLGAKAKTAVELYCFERDALTSYFNENPHIQLIVTTNLNRVIAGRVTLLEALVARNLQRWVAEKYA